MIKHRLIVKVGKDMSLYFQFDFKNHNDQKNAPLIFNDPKKIWQADRIEDVIPMLKEVEEAHRQGLYVAGYLAYEAAAAFDSHFNVHQSTAPLMVFASFESPSHIEKVKNDPFFLHPWQISEDLSCYQQKLAEIKEAIRQGDTYQVNYTVRLFTKFLGDPYGYYLTLKDKQRGNYSAYLQYNDQHILSLSPELFFKVNDQHITTKPMKGTSKRGETPQEDEENKAHLTSSLKERAENMMIVDLLRNDLGQIASKGSVYVSKLLSVETYPTVHQMTSTIEAQLNKDSGLLDWFQALFPCGSITGAPKIKTMAYIKSLEETPRGVYCGAIGYVTPDKAAVFNVPIRTVMINESTHQAVYGVGGGITWDSKETEEFQEVHTKAKVLDIDLPSFSLLESMLLSNGTLIRFDQHITRLKQAAIDFNYPLEESDIHAIKTSILKQYPKGEYKVRLLLAKDGSISVELAEINELQAPVVCYLAHHPVSSKHLFSRYKTTHRAHYDALMIKKSDNFSTLLYNEKGEVTEFTIGNIVIEKEGKLYTPPLLSGCLPGVYRNMLVDIKRVEEKILTINDVTSADAIFLTNSVRGMIEVNLRFTHS